MALTLTNIKDQAKALLDAETSSLWSETQLTALANQANRYVYAKLIEAHPDWFTARASFDYPAATERIDVTEASYLNATPHTIRLVQQTESSGAPSNTNHSWEVVPTTLLDAADMSERHGNSWNPWGRYHYALAGDYLYLVPTPAQAVHLTVTHIPQVADLSGGSDEVLSGTAVPYHDAVTYRLAVLMDVKQEGRNSQNVRALLAEMERQIAALATRRHAQGPRRVIYRRAGR